MDRPTLNAVIGVWHKGPVTYYVKRSGKMANYPRVWSLPSIQYAPNELTDPENLECAQSLLYRMSLERLGNVPVRVKKYLISGDSDQNPYGVHVYLHLYRIELLSTPHLNSDYYTDDAWLTAEEYEKRSAGSACGLCLRLWSDYAWLAGITDRPFLTRRGEMEYVAS